MNDGLLFAYELYRARRDDWLRRAREHRAEERGSKPPRPRGEAAIPPAILSVIPHPDW